MVIAISHICFGCFPNWYIPDGIEVPDFASRNLFSELFCQLAPSEMDPKNFL